MEPAGGSDVIKVGMHISLRGGATRKFCDLKACKSDADTTKSQFVVVSAGAGLVGLRPLGAVCRNRANKKTACDRSHIPSGARLKILDLPGKRHVALFNVGAKKYCSDGAAKGFACNVATEVGKAEKFEVKCLKRCGKGPKSKLPSPKPLPVPKAAPPPPVPPPPKRPTLPTSTDSSGLPLFSALIREELAGLGIKGP